MNDFCSPVGRLAPSPTGLLHLGNIWSFMLAWLSAKSKHGRIVLRMEDIDPCRSQTHFASAILDDLSWIGLDWDEGPDVGGMNGPYTQSLRTALYTKALETLEKRGQLYPCFCTRKELKSLPSAPHNDDVGPVYPGTCRTLSFAERSARIRRGAHYALRLLCTEDCVRFDDQLLGEQVISQKMWGGDFALRRSDGVFAYQLAVAIDDSCMGITEVVRGRDLLLSTPRQLLILEMLHMRKPELYLHVPLLLDVNGERLAKRHKSLSLAFLRSRGVDPKQIVGLLAYLAGMNPDKTSLSLPSLLPRFHPDLLPRNDCRITEDIWSSFVPGIACS
ncbi:MAG: tRNA glutamyl-Q(34) synthetase GluQRS [Desulfovibrio sp.]|nr:tRNA glutamyl-Q(34) synthetase GluQRS [Desulfovibrio sp.]